MIEQHNSAHELLWSQCAEVPKFRQTLGQNRDEIRRVLYEKEAVSRTGWGTNSGQGGSAAELRMMESLSGRHQAPDQMLLVQKAEEAIDLDVEEAAEDDGSQGDIPKGVRLIHPSNPRKVWPSRC